MTERPTPAKRSTRGVGLVGSGFMGRSHALAYATASVVFPLARPPRLAFLADANEDLAARAARELGFARHTGDWRTLVADPEVDLVDVTRRDGSSGPERLAAVQTPQAFIARRLLAAYAASEGDGFVGTDTASCLERYAPDLPVAAVPGDPANLKITFARDFVRAADS